MLLGAEPVVGMSGTKPPKPESLLSIVTQKGRTVKDLSDS